MLIKRQTEVHKSKVCNRVPEFGPRQYVQCSYCIFYMCIFERCCGTRASVLHAVTNNLNADLSGPSRDCKNSMRISEKVKAEQKKMCTVWNYNGVNITFSLHFAETKESCVSQNNNSGKAFVFGFFTFEKTNKQICVWPILSRHYYFLF